MTVFSLTALLSVEKEAQENTEPQPSGPSEGEVALQEALSSLQQQKDAIIEQYQAQVCILLSKHHNMGLFIFFKSN